VASKLSATTAWICSVVAVIVVAVIVVAVIVVAARFGVACAARARVVLGAARVVAHRGHLADDKAQQFRDL
jgi:hypothetical protein